MATDTTEKKTTAPRSRVAEAGRKRAGREAPVVKPGSTTRAKRGEGTDAAPARPRRPRRGSADAGAQTVVPAEVVAGVESPAEGESAAGSVEEGGVGVATEAARVAAAGVVGTAVEAGGALGTDEDTAPAAEGKAPLAIALGAEDAGSAPDTAPGSALLEPEPVREMEFAVKPQVLKAGLTPVVAALPGKTTLPVLGNVLIATEGEGLIRMTATDLDTTVTRTVAAAVTKPGSALVPGKKLQEIAREIPDSCTLDVRLEEETLHLWCEETRTRYKLATIPVDEFPTPPGIQWGENCFTVPGATLALLIERTSFAASTEETRPILNGVLWELGPEEMTMVATNGHRLSATRVAGGRALGEHEVIVHPRALAMVARLPREEEHVRVARTQNHLGFRGEGWEIVTRTIEGPYPNWRQVVPRDNDLVLVADRGALSAAVRRMAIVASEQTHRIRFSLGGPMLRVSVETPDLGAAHEDVPVDYQGDPLEIGFNANYLLELLRYLPAGEVRMSFKAPERAAMLCPVQDEEGIYTEMLVMPLRLLN
jgi:DNA polymerase-3 subunit beta